MSEILLWSLAVFAVLGLPPLLAAVVAWRKERRAARAGQNRGEMVGRGWPGVLVAAMDALGWVQAPLSVL